MAPWLPLVLWRICFRPTHYSMKLPLHCQWHCSRTNKTIVLHLSSLDQSILVCFVGLCSQIHGVSGLKLKDCIYVRNSLFIVDLHLARIRMALSVFVNFWAQDASMLKISVPISKRSVFWNPQDLLLMMGTEIFNIDTSWAEKLMKTRVPFSSAPTVMMVFFHE